MLIRPLTADDAESFRNFRLLALQESPTSFGSSHEEESDRSLAQIASFLVDSPERVVFGAFVDASLAGLCGVGRETALKERHRGFIRSMYVAPEQRGRSLGDQLLRCACERAAQWPGLEQLTLAVSVGNESALALYLRQGFTVYGRAPRALRIGSIYVDELLMVKHLGPVQCSRNAVES